MQKLATIPYEEMHFVYIMNHYDVHLEGLCEVCDELLYFKTINPEEDNIKCDVFLLSTGEKIKYRFKKFLFEQMVGYHWSRDSNKRKGFYYRKPLWLYKRLFKLYYRLKKWKLI
jgi:hypothetical protein